MFEYILNDAMLNRTSSGGEDQGRVPSSAGLGAMGRDLHSHASHRLHSLYVW